MKKIIALVLALMMFFMVGCVSESDLAAKQEEVDSLAADNAQLISEIEALGASKTVYAIQSTINGESSAQFSGTAELTAKASIAEGQIVDHWEINGVAQPDSAADTFSFTAESSGTVAAYMRQEKKITTINAEMRFLDADKKASGDPLTEFVFENDYTNPVTGETVEGGKISAEIKAVIPNGKIIDYWLINGVPYYYNGDVSSFIVEDLDEATTYELILKDKPITYYRVTCSGCTFNGISGGLVAAGTTIYASCNGGAYAHFYVNGGAYASEVKGVSVTINSDTYIEAYAIIN